MEPAAIAILLTLFTAITYGTIEKFSFGHGFHPGAPDFLKFFNLGYHGPLLLLVLAILCGFHTLWALPLWILLEDMFYFIGNKQDQLDVKDWITGGLGGFWLGAQFIPWVYVGLAVLSGLSYLLFA